MRPRYSTLAVMAMLLITVPLMAVPAPAEESRKASFTPREMAHCMMKRFRADHAESYRDAYKACKEQFDLAQADRSETAMNEALAAERSK